jgi:hypothetical protein
MQFIRSVLPSSSVRRIIQPQKLDRKKTLFLVFQRVSQSNTANMVNVKAPIPYRSLNT